MFLVNTIYSIFKVVKSKVCNNIVCIYCNVSQIIHIEYDVIVVADKLS